MGISNDLYLLDGVIRGAFCVVWDLPRVQDAVIGEVQLGGYRGGEGGGWRGQQINLNKSNKFKHTHFDRQFLSKNTCYFELHLFMNNVWGFSH